jgi:hypothetical protein
VLAQVAVEGLPAHVPDDVAERGEPVGVHEPVPGFGPDRTRRVMAPAVPLSPSRPGLAA